jgi:hypothetical protein
MSHITRVIRQVTHRGRIVTGSSSLASDITSAITALNTKIGSAISAA